MAQWILACKELNGIIQIARLPQSVSPSTPGIPDTTAPGGPWYVVGPGTLPSVQAYGTQWILTFNYLSHMFTRVFADINITWPPTEVQPVQISGGPNPPTAFTYNFGVNTAGQPFINDALTMKVEGGTSTGPGVAAYFNPPLYPQPLLFLDPTTSTYSVTIQPNSNWFPQPPVNTQVYYRLYIRPFPYTGSWMLYTDWTVSAVSQPLFSFPFASIGSLRYEFSVTWGTQFLPTQAWNTAAHAEGIPGQTYLTVDSTVQRPNFQAFVNEFLTLKEASYVVAPYFGNRQLFIDVPADDQIQLSRSSLGQGGDTFAFFGTRQAFVNEAGADTLDGGYFPSNPAAFVGGNALKAVMT